MAKMHVGTVDAVAETAVTFNGIAEGVTFNDIGWTPTASMETKPVQGTTMVIEQ